VEIITEPLKEESMPLKKVLLYDAANDPLQVTGIHIELHDPIGHASITSQLSSDLNPLPGGLPSDEFGALLNFPSGKRPVDIVITDAKYKYPGNALRYLNGDLSDDVYMDLLALPSGPGGGAPPSGSTPPELNAWIEGSPNWNREEKAAVRGLIFNYAMIVGAATEDGHVSNHLIEVASNWEQAAKRIGVATSALKAAVKAQAYRTTSASS
jgi:hypothetical protein